MKNKKLETIKTRTDKMEEITRGGYRSLKAIKKRNNKINSYVIMT